MIIKTAEGDHSVTGQGQGNLNTVLGAVGTFGTLMGGGMLGGRLMNGQNGYYNSSDPGSRVITKAEADLMQENTTLKTELAIQKSENYTDKKLVEVTTYFDTKFARLSEKVDANKEAQSSVNAQQAAYNASNNGIIGMLRAQVEALQSVTKLYIPSGNVCESGCCCGNS